MVMTVKNGGYIKEESPCYIRQIYQKAGKVDE